MDLPRAAAVTRAAVVALSLTIPAFVLQGCGNEEECEGSIEGWTSKNGRTCDEYHEHDWCTEDGGYGDGWESSFGTGEDWANKKTGLTAWDACCTCGGGEISRPTPSPAPTPAPRPAPVPVPRTTPVPVPRTTPMPTTTKITTTTAITVTNSTGDPFDGIPQHPNTECWTRKPDSFSRGYADGVSTHYSLAVAQKLCMDMGASACRAVTCSTSTECTVRRSQYVTSTRSGDTTFVAHRTCYPEAKTVSIDSTAEAEEEEEESSMSWVGVVFGLLGTGALGSACAVYILRRRRLGHRGSVIHVVVSTLSAAVGKPSPARSSRSVVAPSPPSVKEIRRHSFEADAAADGYSINPVASNEEMDMLRGMMIVNDPHNLGYGRDVRESQKYTNLKVVSAWRITKPDKKLVYEANRNIVAANIRRARNAGITVRSVSTQLETTSQKAGCETDTNEKLLLHGTKPESVMSIIQNGLNERVSGGLFGHGVYLAEDPSKIDQYCTADDGSSTDEQTKELHRRTKFPGGRIFYAFAVRVCLGAPAYTKDGDQDMDTSKNLWVTGDRRELNPIEGVVPPVPHHCLIAEAKNESGYKVKRHREFITFNGDRTLLEYLIAYQRI